MYVATTYICAVSTPAETRRKRETLRKAGWYAIAVGAIAVLAAVVALFIQVSMLEDGVFCGGVIDALLFGALPNGCAAVLAGHAQFAIAVGVIAVLAFVAGGVLVARGSRSGIVKVGA